MKKYIAPKCIAIAFHSESIMAASDGLKTNETVTTQDDYSDKRGWDSEIWLDCEE